MSCFTNLLLRTIMKALKVLKTKKHFKEKVCKNINEVFSQASLDYCNGLWKESKLFVYDRDSLPSLAYLKGSTFADRNFRGFAVFGSFRGSLCPRNLKIGHPQMSMYAK